MVEKVIKKQGVEERFIKEKITVSAVKAGAPLEKARDIADEVEEEVEGKIKSEELREKVLDKLEAEDPELRVNWETYDRAVKKIYDR